MNKEVEIWKDIPGYEGLYQVSNLGRVKSLKYRGGKYEKVMVGGINGSGYRHVILRCNGEQKTKKIHQLVAIAFLNHKPNGYELVVDHINDNKLDNRVENLQIVTQRFNAFKTQGKYSSMYKGVSLNKMSNRWESKIVINGKKKYLGLFKCELAASYAYQKALREYEQKIN
jgi:hypothetical protein